MTDYTEFLQSKRLVVPSCGIEVEPDALNEHLFPFQRSLVQWSLRKGRSAIFATTGMGKTLMQLAWAERAAERVLIVAPLVVSHQTVREGEKFGIPVTYARSMEAAPERGITITNYEMVERFDPAAFGAVVLDESGILKNYAGAYRTMLIERFRATPYRLACTATPAPNDIAEMANHAEFLSVMTRVEMLAAFFLHDDAGWRLKRHAREPFYRWLASWGMSLNRPSDIGFSDEGYDLPPLSINLELVETDYTPSDRLFATELKGITERAQVRRETVTARVDRAYSLVKAEPEEPWIVWCGLNAEADMIADALGDEAVNVEGPQSPDEKTERLLAFLSGEVRVLVTKGQVAGHGLNLQHCARQVFVGMSDSYELYFQCLRRCWRYGQTREVIAYIVLTEPEEQIYANVLRKEREATAMSEALIRHVSEFERAELATVTTRDDYRAQREMRLPRWLSNGSGPSANQGDEG